MHISCMAMQIPLPHLTNDNLLVVGLPSAPPSPEFLPESFTSVVLAWSSPTDYVCIISYTIALTNITKGNTLYTYNTTTNTTSLTLSNLIQGTEYSFTVAGVDTGGRVGEKSVPSEELTLDGKVIY